MWKLDKAVDPEADPKVDRKAEDPKRSAHSAKGRRRPWIWAERLLLVAGLALLTVYAAARIESIISSRQAIKTFDALESSAEAIRRGLADTPEQQEPPALLERADSPAIDFTLWDKHRVQAYEDAVSARPGAPVAVLRIAKIHLETPVLDGTDDLTLNHAVGRIIGTAKPGEEGNIGIAGHRDSFFRGLKDVGVGDAIELRTLNGTNNYVVDQIRIVKPDDVSVLQPRLVPSLTLVTCYPFYCLGSAPLRYIVTASLARETKGGPENRSLSSLSQLSSSARR